MQKMAGLTYLCLFIVTLFWMLQCSSCTTDPADSASEIASRIISEVCDSTDAEVQEFYKSVKSSYASSQAEQYPLLGKGLL